jgi:hypothetical protein
MGKKDEEDAPRKAAELAKIDREKQKILAKIAEGQPTDERGLVEGIKIHLTRSVEDMLQTGKKLVLLREIIGYGTFTAYVEEKFKIPSSSAYRFMNAALKSINYPAIGSFSNVSKVYALIEAPEEALEEFEKEGTLAGKTKDDLELMTQSQLIGLVKKMKAEKADHKDGLTRTISKQEKELHRLQGKIDIYENGTPTDDEQAMIKLLWEQKNKFSAVINLLNTIDPESVTPAIAFEVVGLYEYIEKYAGVELLEARRKFNDPSGPVAEAEIDEAAQKPVRGRWENLDKMAGGRHA